MKRVAVTVVVIAVVLVAADFFLKAAAENAAAELIDKRIAEKVESDVNFAGFPFLLSLVRGTFEEINVDIRSASEGDLRVEDIRLTFADVDVEAREVLEGRGSMRAGSLRGSGNISEETINEIAAAHGRGLEVDIQSGQIRVSAWGTSVPANAVVARNALLLSAEDVLGPVEIPLPALLPEVRFTSVRAENGRLVLGVRASRLRITS